MSYPKAKYQLYFWLLFAQYEERTAKLKADVPVLEGIVAKQWGKEDELKQLKSYLAALNRKITAQLAPKHDEKDGEEIKRDDQKQAKGKTVDISSQPDSPKRTMVAEPTPRYSGGYAASASASFHARPKL